MCQCRLAALIAAGTVVKYLRRAQRETSTSPIITGTSIKGPITAANAAPLSIPNVATATAIALLVDVFRMPVYAALQHREVLAQWPLIVVATIGVVLGTLSGKWMLSRIPQNIFRMMVAGIILALGIWMLAHPGA